jgi:hypothetical protein
MHPHKSKDEIRAWKLAEAALDGRYWTCKSLVLTMVFGVMTGFLCSALIFAILR